MINKDRLRLWVADLRSNDYQQCQGWLHEVGDGYCCLGVGCDTAKKNGLPIVVREIEGRLGAIFESPPHKRPKAQGSDSLMPRFVMRWFGIPSSIGGTFKLLLARKPSLYGDTTTIVDLAELNDDGWSFNQIADIVEWYFDL